ncbi:iron chaperone [Catenulispora yoronensis]
MTAKKSDAATDTYQGFSDDERAAMKAHAKEQKATARRSKDTARADGEADIQAKLAEMTGSDRALGEKLHEIISTTAPHLIPRTWYGMPAYAKDGKVVCFFKCAAKFKARYATLGFSDAASSTTAPSGPPNSP